MFGHSAFAEYPFAGAAGGTYDLTQKVMSFAVAETIVHTAALDVSTPFDGSTGWLSPTAHSFPTGGSGFIAWPNAANAYASDNSYAGGTISGYTGYHNLFSAFNANIPADSTINGLELRIEVKQSVTDSNVYWSANPTYDITIFDVDSTISSSQANIALSGAATGDATYTVGSTTGWASTYWGNFSDDGSTFTYTPTLAQINSSNFGVYINLMNLSASSRVVSLDMVQIKVYFTPPVAETLFEFGLTESIAHAATLKRTRKVVPATIAESITHTAALKRTRKVSAAITNTEAHTAVLKRTRTTPFAIVETETVSASLNRLKQVTLALAETYSYTFSVAKIKLLSAAINEIETHSFGALRRTRKVAAALNEVIAHASTLKRSRKLVAAISEQEAIAAVLKRARKLQGALNESLTHNISASRKRDVSTTIAELEAVSMSLGKLKLLAYAIAQTESHSNYLVNRVRNATVAVNEVEALTASFNRARTVVLPIAENESFTLNFGRLREQAFNIATLQGIDAAINRIREIVQSVANTTEYTFNIYVQRSDPATLNVLISWQEWQFDGSVHKLVDRTETALVIAKASSAHQVITSGAATVVVSDEAFDTFVVETESGTTIVIPTGTL